MSDTSGVWILLDCWAGCKHNEPPATSINYAPVNSFRIHACARIYTATANGRAHIRACTHMRAHRLYMHRGDMYRLVHSVAPTYSQHALMCQIDLLGWRLTCLPVVCGIHFVWFLDLNLRRTLVKGGRAFDRRLVSSEDEWWFWPKLGFQRYQAKLPERER